MTASTGGTLQSLGGSNDYAAPNLDNIKQFLGFDQSRLRRGSRPNSPTDDGFDGAAALSASVTASTGQPPYKPHPPPHVLVGGTGDGTLPTTRRCSTFRPTHGQHRFDLVTVPSRTSPSTTTNNACARCARIRTTPTRFRATVPSRTSPTAFTSKSRLRPTHASAAYGIGRRPGDLE